MPAIRTSKFVSQQRFINFFSEQNILGILSTLAGHVENVGHGWDLWGWVRRLALHDCQVEEGGKGIQLVDGHNHKYHNLRKFNILFLVFILRLG